VGHLEIAAQQDDADRRLDGEGEAVDDAVGDADGVHAEGAGLDGLTRGEQPEVGLHPALAQSAAHEAEGEPAAVDGGVRRRLHREGERADVVLVPVGEDDRAHGAASFREVLEVGYDGVDARHLRGGEAHARVHEQALRLPLEDERIEAELAEPAQTHQAQPAVINRQALISGGELTRDCGRSELPP
jgi:hypothetical protein